jgi:hypothetical protein
MRIPVAVVHYMNEVQCTEAETREYILSQIRIFEGLKKNDPHPEGWSSVSTERWIACKLSCTARAAHNAIQWAIATQALPGAPTSQGP